MGDFSFSPIAPTVCNVYALDMFKLSTSELVELRQAINAELSARETQLAILTETLERLLAAGANDDVIENIVSAIDILDSASLAAEDVEPEPQPELEPETPETISNRREVITQLRSLGYTAPGVDGLIRLYHRDLAEQEYLKAELEVRGHMLKSEYKISYKARNLWFCNLRELRKYASDEMLTWFDANGRLTYNMLRDKLLSGKYYAGSGYINNR